MTKPYIFITRKCSEQQVKDLYEIADVEMWPEEEVPCPREILVEKAKKADGLLTMLSDSIDQELLDVATNLKVVANLAVGFDNIDITYAEAKGIVVCHTPDILTDTTADLTFGLLLSTARRLIEAADYVKNNQWKSWGPLLLAGHDVHHKTIGIVGMGKIGQALAKRATGFEMDILYHNRSRNSEAEESLGAKYCSLDELLQASDFVVCLTPLTNDTKELFNRKSFQKMKSTAIFINAGRGAVVNEQDLYEALTHKEIAGAGLDVFTKEPISADHPLVGLPNVLALPHIGSASVETRLSMIELCAANIYAVLTGMEPKTRVKVK
ncbi:glyoxylate reductase [Metabacillus crassostreae]|uniref:2-hydroxyacid dehydrogenase n=1 Tax=Metabacillus crassostreae TaxID=929098 RepID=UPI0019569737|nr:D-glycerate dehydrogenase [Metabacillus crassostreae]MBM7605390.1 glyoxylate reductase [Metabacillus crassostreae]